MVPLCRNFLHRGTFGEKNEKIIDFFRKYDKIHAICKCYAETKKREITQARGEWCEPL